MKKHLAIRIGILFFGFLLIYIYDHWDSWFNDFRSIGGNSGMTIPIYFVLIVCWTVVWCFLLLIEVMITYIHKNKQKRIANLITVAISFLLLIIYIQQVK